MDSKTFAELYADQFVKVINYDEKYYGSYNNEKIGRVVGYSRTHHVGFGDNYHNIYIEISKLPVSAGWNKKEIDILVVDSNSIRNGIYVYPVYNLQPVIQPKTEPDDCDDCGAVGEQACKEGCPNQQ